MKKDSKSDMLIYLSLLYWKRRKKTVIILQVIGVFSEMVLANQGSSTCCISDSDGLGASRNSDGLGTSRISDGLGTSRSWTEFS